MNEDGREDLAFAIALDIANTLSLDEQDAERVRYLILRVFDYEALFRLPDVDFVMERSVAEYWELKEELTRQRDWLENTTEITDALTKFGLDVFRCLVPEATDREPATGEDGLVFQVRRIDQLDSFDERIEAMLAAAFAEELEHLGILTRLTKRLETNLVVASGGNPCMRKSASSIPRISSTRFP